MIGRTVLTRDFNIAYGRNDISLPSSNWIRGMYVIRFAFAGGAKMVRKVVKD